VAANATKVKGDEKIKVASISNSRFRSNARITHPNKEMTCYLLSTHIAAYIFYYVFVLLSMLPLPNFETRLRPWLRGAGREKGKCGGHLKKTLRYCVAIFFHCSLLTQSLNHSADQLLNDKYNVIIDKHI